MSYDVELRQDEKVVKVESHEEGGTYVMGGCDSARLNITYNYAPVYALLHFSIRDLNGCQAKDTIRRLVHTVEKLGTYQDEDYWAATTGNAGYAANILLNWALLYPEAIWEVT